MNTIDNRKEAFLTLYNQLTYDYQNAILSTFRCLITDETYPTRRKTLFDVSGIIRKYQADKKYTDQEVCDAASKLANVTNPNIFLDIGTYRKIKYRNSQSSKSTTNWLTYIAKVLEFNEDEYYKYLSDEGVALMTNRSYSINTIETLYDLLKPKEKIAIFQLATSLLKIKTVSENIEN